jgi:hypothetical protein
MRMTNQTKDIDSWVKLFITLHENGVDTLHSSIEYESFDLFKEVLKKTSQKSKSIQFKHVVKLADPSFNELHQGYIRIQTRIEEYLKHLRCDQIDMVQWMWRANLNEDKLRVENFRNSLSQLEDVVLTIKQSGLANKFMCFPYSLDFGMTTFESKALDGYFIYRNPNELEMQPLLDEAYKKDKQTYSIRPFAAGALIKDSESNINSLVKFSQNHPGVKGVVTSISSEKHLLDLLNSF